MNVNSIFSWVQGTVKLRGNSDNTLIGNVSDRLKVDAAITSNSNDSYVKNNQKYSATTQVAMASNALFNPILLFRNPLGSGKQAILSTIFPSQTVDNVYCIYRLYEFSTITLDGTALIPLPCNINNAQPASAMQLYTLPVVSNLGTVFRGRFNGSNSTGINLIENESFILQPNSFVVLAGQPSANNRFCELTLGWAEI